MKRSLPASGGFGTVVSIGLTLVVPASAAEPAPATSSGHVARIETAALRVVVADNEAWPPRHQAGYNGVADLRLGDRGRPNLFVPMYGGLNFEHVFSGDADSFAWDIFEPRRAALELRQTSNRRVESSQRRTEHWPLRSRLVYEVEGDAIDLTYHGTPLEDVWRKHGYIGLFFASYIDAPEDLAIQFIGRSRPDRGDATPRWIRHRPDKHGVAANHRPAGSTWDPTFDEGFPLTLASAPSDFEYVYPFYFGRSGGDVLIMMFERQDDGGEVRFAQSPSGGGPGNPAWDFIYFRRSYGVGREFRFRTRAVYRKFTDLEDVVRAYERWSGETVRRPQP